jgi:ribonuclease P protein component
MNKTYHVRKNEEIERIVKNKDTTGDQFFVIYKLSNPACPHLRFAVSVPKKFGIAVARNRMRRRVREIIQKANLKDEYDYLFVVKPAAAPLDFTEIRNDLYKLFAKAKIIEG